MKRSASLPFVIVPVLARPGREREGVAAGARLGKRVRPDGTRGEPGQIPSLHVIVAPFEEGIDDEGVLHVHEHAHGGIDAGQFFDGQHGMEEPAPGAAVGLRHFDAHDAQFEELIDERLGELRMLVHFPHERPNASFGELTDAVAEDNLILGEYCERLSVIRGFLGHERGLLKITQNMTEWPMLSSAIGRRLSAVSPG
jgi:hypothetical protein